VQGRLYHVLPRPAALIVAWYAGDRVFRGGGAVPPRTQAGKGMLRQRLRSTRDQAADGRAGTPGADASPSAPITSERKPTSVKSLQGEVDPPVCEPTA
jgi:hypothetical protein